MKHRCIGLAVFSYAKFKMRSMPSVSRSGFQCSMRWCGGSGISWTICTLLQTDNHASAILLESFTCPSWCATNSVKALKVVHIYPSLSQGDHSTWKVMEFSKTISRPGKSWKTAKVMESHGESWKMMMMSSNFFVKMHIIHCLPSLFPVLPFVVWYHNGILFHAVWSRISFWKNMLCR